ncbi:MAG: hypothetical protein GTO14_17065 [Anaerolineales bacterium]|nr:hypothetical protein [Anaerolineales bacterium]
MDPEKQQIKGVPRYALTARLKAKRARTLWHFGPKYSRKKLRKESVDRMLLRMRHNSKLSEL